MEAPQNRHSKSKTEKEQCKNKLAENDRSKQEEKMISRTYEEEAEGRVKQSWDLMRMNSNERRYKCIETGLADYAHNFAIPVFRIEIQLLMVND